MNDDALRPLRIEYDITRPEPVGVSFVVQEGGEQKRMTGWLGPAVAVHYGSLLTDLGQRAADYWRHVDDEGKDR